MEILDNPRKFQNFLEKLKFFQEILENPEKFWNILENSRKSRENLENFTKCWEILNNSGKSITKQKTLKTLKIPKKHKKKQNITKP